MIFNDNKYIIINDKFWNILCPIGKDKETPITYTIYSNHIIINFEDNIQLKFSVENKNIIEKSCFHSYLNSNYRSNYYEIEKIYKNIIIYYNFENSFSHHLKNANKKQSIGYFVDKISLDEWKK